MYILMRRLETGSLVFQMLVLDGWMPSGQPPLSRVQSNSDSTDGLATIRSELAMHDAILNGRG